MVLRAKQGNPGLSNMRRYFSLIHMDNNGLWSYALHVLMNEHITPDILCKNVINEQAKLVVCCKFVSSSLVLRDNLPATEILNFGGGL